MTKILLKIMFFYQNNNILGSNTMQKTTFWEAIPSKKQHSGKQYHAKNNILGSNATILGSNTIKKTTFWEAIPSKKQHFQ